MGRQEDEEIEWNELINDPERFEQWNSMRTKRMKPEVQKEEFHLGDYVKSPKSSFSFGESLLKMWLYSIVAIGLIIGTISLINPSESSDPKPGNQCTTVEHNGEAIDTCEYLTP
jgi:hypothetical protein